MENANQLNQLGKYQLIEEIGRGGFAQVYKAHDPDLERLVAVKVLAPHLTWEPSFVAQFKAEAQAVAQLRHPNIVIIHDIGQDKGKLFLVTEYLSGQTLQLRLRDSRPLPLEQTADILRQIAAALDYAHSRGILHRDVKPANIMLANDGHATLMDFGLVKAMAGSQYIRNSMQVLGTPEYISPEQAEGQPLDHRADLYALGVVAYQLCTGRVPFRSDTPLTLLRLHADKTPPPPREANPALPPKVGDVLLKALAKEPAQRYQSGDEFAKAFETAIRIKDPPPPPPSDKNWLALIGVVALLAVVVGLVGLLLRGPSPDGSTALTATAQAAETATQIALASTTTDTPTPTATSTSSPVPGPVSDAVVAGAFTSLRRQPALYATAIITLKQGDEARLLAVNDNFDWVQAVSQNRTGWLPVDKLTVNIDIHELPVKETSPTRTPTPKSEPPTPIASSTSDAVVAGAFTSLRRQPALYATAIITLKQGDEARLLAVNDNFDWVQAVSQNRTGWLPVDKLTINIDLDSLPLREVDPTYTPTPTPITVGATSETTPQVPSSPKLKVFLGSVGNEENDYGKLVRQFTAETGIEVDVVTGPQSATDFLNEQMEYLTAGSSEIDVFQIDVIWPGIMAPYAVDLSEYVSADAISAHFPTLIENNTKNGKLVGLPWQTDAGLLYYRTDLLEKYGYSDPPETWDELETMAGTIQQGERAAGNDNFWGFVWQGNAYEGLTCDALEWQASEGGGLIIEPEGVITVNNPAAAAAMERAAGWVGTISPPGVTGYQEEDSRGVWQSGNAAFMRNWPYAYALSSDPNDGQVAGKFDIATLPAGAANRSAATLGGWQLMVSRHSNNIEAAARFVAFMTGYEAQKARAISSGYLPTIPDLYQDQAVLAAQPQVTRLLAVFNNSVARPSTVADNDYNAVSNAYFNAVHDILTGRSSAGNALADLERELVNITGLPTGTP